ncbi:uncharacterized protein MYCFIDRAFT_208855 [Pseudocercospora fijiensis CIRAD86]|uniref:Protein PBN1 n=1 Tax=Pseudocercospora fijiensis (strain CIRAD86) TaxID=383855 RepID=M3A4W1_PSEFD|nr:uncharacterized protein MYCFIDRAFT_208855 [Pseudocercospora fijiensis CIRAD86]EME79646.1 hypothetical protein MYCFIDRAFT_208855 [Pseudocercospora fijiensis CIRAD86]
MPRISWEFLLLKTTVVTTRAVPAPGFCQKRRLPLLLHATQLIDPVAEFAADCAVLIPAMPVNIAQARAKTSIFQQRHAHGSALASHLFPPSPIHKLDKILFPHEHPRQSNIVALRHTLDDDALSDSLNLTKSSSTSPLLTVRNPADGMALWTAGREGQEQAETDVETVHTHWNTVIIGRDAAIPWKPAHTSDALLPFNQHRERRARPPQTGGTGLELVSWSVAVLDAQARSCFEIEHELVKAIKTIVPPTTSVDVSLEAEKKGPKETHPRHKKLTLSLSPKQCTVTVTHTLTSSRVKIVDMLLPWSYSLVIKDHVRTEWPVYAEDHEPLMPEEFLTTTMPGPTSSMRGTTYDDEWLAVLTESSDINDMEELASNIKSFLEAIYADVQPTGRTSQGKHLPVSTTLTTDGLLLGAPSTVRELKHILRIYLRPATDRVREEIEKRNRRAGTWSEKGAALASVGRPSVERWRTMYGDGKVKGNGCVLVGLAGFVTNDTLSFVLIRLGIYQLGANVHSIHLTSSYTDISRKKFRDPHQQTYAARRPLRETPNPLRSRTHHYQTLRLNHHDSRRSSKTIETVHRSSSLHLIFGLLGFFLLGQLFNFFLLFCLLCRGKQSEAAWVKHVSKKP